MSPEAYQPAPEPQETNKSCRVGIWVGDKFLPGHAWMHSLPTLFPSDTNTEIMAKEIIRNGHNVLVVDGLTASTYKYVTEVPPNTDMGMLMSLLKDSTIFVGADFRTISGNREYDQYWSNRNNTYLPLLAAPALGGAGVYLLSKATKRDGASAKLSRREFLGLGVGAVAGASIVAGRLAFLHHQMNEEQREIVGRIENCTDTSDYDAKAYATLRIADAAYKAVNLPDEAISLINKYGILNLRPAIAMGAAHWQGQEIKQASSAANPNSLNLGLRQLVKRDIARLDEDWERYVINSNITDMISVTLYHVVETPNGNLTIVPLKDEDGYPASFTYEELLPEYSLG